MHAFCTYQNAKRLPAEAFKPVVDPAGWDPDELRDVDRWSYYLTNEDKEEILAGVAAVRKAGVAVQNVRKENFPLKNMLPLIEHVKKELRDGRGVVRLRDFPLEHMSREEAVMGYLGLGAHIGSLEPQNSKGHLIGHVKNFRNAGTKDDTRGYQSYVESSFHVDSTDIVGLLCLHEAKQGGESRLASSVTVYNRMLTERPDMIEPLMQDFYKTRYGEQIDGENAYYKTPIFAFVDGWFSALGYSTGFEAAGVALVAVSDTGAGLSDEIADQLFQPFMTTKAQGMGVGLSISKSIIENHGGRIWVEANPEGGAVFKFTLPIAVAEDPADE